MFLSVTVARLWIMFMYDFFTIQVSVLQDGKLTKEEILDKYDVFVGSQATDFGEALTRHDEF